MPELTREVIPILVYWAKYEHTEIHAYGDMTRLLHYEKGARFSGKLLWNVNSILSWLKENERTIPAPPLLSGLVSRKGAGIPSDGLKAIVPDYDILTDEEKREMAHNYNEVAHRYPCWDKVLDMLGLVPRDAPDSEDSSSYVERDYAGYGCGEGPEHKALKEYILKHPELVGALTGEVGETEYSLRSGDKLDVYFPKLKIAVEVKSKISNDKDIYRGLYQCVKYKATLDATDKVDGVKPENKVILVLGREMTDDHKKVQKKLGVTVVENVKPK